MPNVFDPVLRHAQESPDSTAIRHSTGNTTYARLRDDVLRLSAVIRDHGVRHGDRVLLSATTSPEFVLAYLAVQALGATVVPVNTMATAPELDYIIGDSGCVLAVHARTRPGALREAAARHTVECLDLASVDARAVETPPARPADRDASEIAGILYTSGTTGRPKGVMLTVANVLAAGEICAELSQGGPGDRVGTALPLFHVFGASSVMMMALTLGASLSLQERFDPPAFLDLMAHDEMTVVAGVPTMWNALLRAYDGRTPADFARLRIATSGGAPLPTSIAAEFEAKFGCQLRDGYGMTESTALATYSRPEGHAPGYTGPAVPRLTVEVRDQDGQRCAPGVVGEVHISGPTVMAGYLGRPDATAEALTPDGWLRTGDLGETNAAGELRIVDRIKDLIIRGGYNVYPAEVEDALYRHPRVLEAAVFGIPDEHYGEEVAAMIVPRPGSELSEDEIERWCRQELSAYKRPRKIAFTESLPKNSTGKILKQRLRAASGVLP